MKGFTGTPDFRKVADICMNLPQWIFLLYYKFLTVKFLVVPQKPVLELSAI